jgi:hypothetical protein
MSGWKKWERTCAEQFSRWLAGKPGSDLVADKHILCRQSLMGRMVERKYGDLAIHPDCIPPMRPLAEWFMKQIMVDAKNRKAFRVPSLITSPLHPFIEWWSKLTVTASEQMKWRLMVILNKPSNEHILIFGQPEREWLNKSVGDVQKLIPVFQFRPVNGSEVVTICQLEDFLESIDPFSLGCPKASEAKHL